MAQILQAKALRSRPPPQCPPVPPCEEVQVPKHSTGNHHDLHNKKIDHCNWNLYRLRDVRTSKDLPLCHDKDVGDLVDGLQQWVIGTVAVGNTVEATVIVVGDLLYNNGHDNNNVQDLQM